MANSSSTDAVEFGTAPSSLYKPGTRSVPAVHDAVIRIHLHPVPGKAVVGGVVLDCLLHQGAQAQSPADDFGIEPGEDNFDEVIARLRSG